MKKYIIFIFFIQFTVTLSVQMIDSLENLLVHADGIKKIDIYLNLANLYDNSNASRSVEYSQKAINLINKFKNHQKLGNAYLILGNSYYSISKFDSAEYFFNKSIIIFKEKKDSQNLADALSNLGNVFYYYGSDFNKSLDLLYQANEIYKKLKLDEKLANNWVNIANTYKIIGNKDDYHKYYDSALKTYSRTNNISGISRCLMDIAENNMFNGDYDDAIRNYNKALTINKKINNKIIVGTIYNKIGNVYLYKGLISSALENYNKSMIIAKEVKDMRYIAYNLTSIGIVYDNISDDKTSESYYLRALEIYNKAQIITGKGYVYANLGNLYTKRNDFVKADYYLRLALDLMKKCNDDFGYAGTLINLGVVYDETGRHEEAIKTNKEAADFYIKIKDYGGAAQSLFALGKVYNHTNRIKEALKMLFSAEEYAVKSDQFPILKSVYRELALVLHYSGKLKQSNSYFFKYLRISDSINPEISSKEIGSQEAKHKFEQDQLIKQRKDEETKRKEKNEIDHRNRVQYLGIFLFVIFLFGTFILLGKLNVKLSSFQTMVFVMFLLLYEFITVFIEPWVDKITSSIPIYKMLINVSVALILTSLQKFEKYLSKNFVKIKID